MIKNKRLSALNKIDAESQAYHIERLSHKRVIGEQTKRYLSAYPLLLSSIQAQTANKSPDIVLISHAIYAWMPTQIHFQSDEIDHANAVVRNAIDHPDKVTESDVDVLAKAFGTTKGNSKVAASKILHFIKPDHFPMWDSNVKKTWGSQKNFNYIEYKNAIHAILVENAGHQAVASIREVLNQHGFQYPISNIRALELILFLSDKER